METECESVIKEEYLKGEILEDPEAGFEVSIMLQLNASPSYDFHENNILNNNMQCRTCGDARERYSSS